MIECKTTQINDPSSPLEEVIELWVHGKSPHTQRYYRQEDYKFLLRVGKPLDLVTLADVQAYATLLSRSELAASSQARAIAAIKSFFSFAHRAKQLRFAQANGCYDAFFEQFNDTYAKSRAFLNSDAQ